MTQSSHYSSAEKLVKEIISCYFRGASHDTQEKLKKPYKKLAWKHHLEKNAVEEVKLN